VIQMKFQRDAHHQHGEKSVASSNKVSRLYQRGGQRDMDQREGHHYHIGVKGERGEQIPQEFFGMEAVLLSLQRGGNGINDAKGKNRVSYIKHTEVGNAFRQNTLHVREGEYAQIEACHRYRVHSAEVW